jgi:hypothetical protein
MNYFGAEQFITTPDGKKWKLSRLEIRIIRQFRDWIASCEGDPFELVDRYIGKLPDTDIREMMNEAKATWDQLKNFSIGSPLSIKYMQTEEGVFQLVRLLLLENHPGVSDADVFAVTKEVSSRMGEVLETAQGSAPNAVAPVA